LFGGNPQRATAGGSGKFTQNGTTNSGGKARSSKKYGVHGGCEKKKKKKPRQPGETVRKKKKNQKKRRGPSTEWKKQRSKTASHLIRKAGGALVWGGAGAHMARMKTVSGSEKS